MQTKPRNGARLLMTPSELNQLDDDELVDSICDTVCGIDTTMDIFREYADDLDQLFKLVDELKSRSSRGLATRSRARSSLDS